MLANNQFLFPEKRDLDLVMLQKREHQLWRKRMSPTSCNSSSNNDDEDVTTRASKKRRLTATKVRFSEESNTVTFKHVNSDDLKSAWYHPREIAAFKQDSKNSIYELYRVQGDLSRLRQEDFCIRGLEHVVTPMAAMAQKKSRKERVLAVLYQQQLQRDTCTSNPELLQLVSSLCSQAKCEEAVRMGLLDAQVWNDC